MLMIIHNIIIFNGVHELTLFGFSIYCKSKYEAQKAWNTIVQYLQNKLKLPINQDKNGIRRPTNFHILGFVFVPTYVKGSKGKYQLVVAPNRWERLKSKLKTLTRKTTPMSLDKRIAKLKEVCRGWINSFKYASMQNKLIQIDGWLRNRIHYCIWHHWNRNEVEFMTKGNNKPNKKKRSLIRLGVDSGRAYAWSRSRLGGWATAKPSRIP